MLHQQLHDIETSPLGRWGAWLPALLAGGAGLTAAVLLLLVGQRSLAPVPIVVGVACAVFLQLRARPRNAAFEPVSLGPDFSLVGAVLELSSEPAALTSSEASLLVANAAYRERFGAESPLALAVDADSGSALAVAKSMAWRDGAGCVAGVGTKSGKVQVEVERAGSNSDLLLWRFPRTGAPRSARRPRALAWRRRRRAADGCGGARCGRRCGRMRRRRQRAVHRAGAWRRVAADPAEAERPRGRGGHRLCSTQGAWRGGRALPVDPHSFRRRRCAGRHRAPRRRVAGGPTGRFGPSAGASRRASRRPCPRRPRRPLPDHEPGLPPGGGDQGQRSADLSRRPRRQGRQGSCRRHRAAQCTRAGHVRRSCRPPRPAARRAGGSHHRRPARARRRRRAAPAQGQ